APCAVVVFVQNHAIPIRRVDPFVFRFDAACAGISAEIVLKRSETDDRPPLVGSLVRQAARRDELPAPEVYVRLQVLFPSALHRRLERKYQHLPPSYLLRQLVGGKSLPKPHLRIPQGVGGLFPVAL